MKNKKYINLENFTLYNDDCFKRLKKFEHKSVDMIFADPPYALKELPEVPTCIFERDLLRPDGIFVMEHPANYDFSQLPYFDQHRVYGSVNFSIFRK